MFFLSYVHDKWMWCRRFILNSILHFTQATLKAVLPHACCLDMMHTCLSLLSCGINHWNLLLPLNCTRGARIVSLGFSSINIRKLEHNSGAWIVEFEAKTLLRFPWERCVEYLFVHHNILKLVDAFCLLGTAFESFIVSGLVTSRGLLGRWKKFPVYLRDQYPIYLP